ncbi:MAG: HslU--HslV peptidase ATPase subunit [Candidatus Fraserbacteria bacterium RBG_16_55_9]|uniref:HslU--HslV peptidase ATPase subunit n=1 Tax=Fraserbacteria sp. (strain RBG_16_55_9) TaxID=1817864 RepID=A0A1F5UPE6_FRAXR|nr:MAG: HslU--HslV peptidase ATPase subunit [Candidatus Fraserbacteria bacterium RBG_16_55_9]
METQRAERLDALSPKEIVAELDKYIVGQREAKRAVAIALRNRIRRQRVQGPLRQEIQPKNILMIGPTGVGKTEISRRLAKLTSCPFLKVEATKFTEIGYVGRDVDSMIRDLIEVSLGMAREEEIKRVEVEARRLVEERILDALLPRPTSTAEEREASFENTREKFREKLCAGELEDRYIEIRAQESSLPKINVFSNEGLEQIGIDLSVMADLMPQRTVTKKLKIQEARELLFNQEADKLLNHEEIRRRGLQRAEETGIIFIDEIDKLGAGGREERHGPGVSRQGVQRDLLPLLDGTTVRTRHGHISTGNILFIAAGAFTMAKPSDLIPELQGRLPIRVELHPLVEEDLQRILTEPEDSLVKQYQALLAVENLQLEFTDAAIREIARIAHRLNESMENIGARRLQTVMEKLMEDISFDTVDLLESRKFTVEADYVNEKLVHIAEDLDLSRYIL